MRHYRLFLPRESAAKMITIGLLMMALSACALPDVFRTVEDKGGDAVDQAYALVAVFNAVDEAALAFAENPDTPAEVKAVIKKLRAPAAAAVPLIAEAAKTARAALDSIANLQMAGGEVQPTDAEEAVAALQVLNDRFEAYAPAIQTFIAHVKQL